jgi:tRNA uracil 4-sulfurtransferase
MGMRYDHILIRFGEIALKGRNRKKFVERLKKNVSQKLKEFPNKEIIATRDRMYIKLNGDPYQEMIDRLTDVFGIQSFSPALKVESEISKIKEAALSAIKQLDYEGKTFKVSAKRADKQFPYTSNELNHEIGSYILRNTNNLTVDVHHPDIDVRVEVRKEATYITYQDIQGAGGLPVGSSGKAMLMLSGGIDSPVAGYLAMKRGLEIEAVHFYSPPFTSERSKQKVLDLVQQLTKFGHTIRLHIVPFTEVQQLINKRVLGGYSLISTRRYMLKITDEIRRRNNGLAIVTGESLGQVASQTLESMYVINEMTNTPILRPLISMDKTEIIDISKKIGTYDISIRPYEDCCTIFTPADPKTKPRRTKIHHYESYLDNIDELVQKAVNETETIVFEDHSALDHKDEFEELF